MEQSNPPGRSYWDLLTAATDALEAGDLPKAEGDYHLACDQRQGSPGRIFFSETITDKLNQLVRGKAQAKAHGGRWNRRTGQFRQEFMAAGEKIVRKAVRLAELRPEDDAQNNQPILETALFLVGRSRLFAEEPSSAVPLLKGIFRTAGKTGLPFDAQLIRHDIPLSEEDRLWLARKGPEMLEEFVVAGSLKPGTVETEAWVRIILQLLNPRYFSSVGRLAEERAWLEAVTADHLLGQSQASVELYIAYLQVNSEPGPRPDEARIRLLEIQANVDKDH